MLSTSIRNQVVEYLHALRRDIIASFETLEAKKRFEPKKWEYHKGSGGGEMNILRGDVFEKAAVNWSGISGKTFPMKDGSGPFFATGVSLITHMMNPHAPTVHMNVRYIETENSYWFGGGYDLTPMGFPHTEDTSHFHNTSEASLGKHYKTFFENAKEYFYIPHRQKERGVGGTFFDHYNTGDIEADFRLMRTVGDSFLPAIMPIYTRRIYQPYTPTEKTTQQTFRGHYVEFNLVYDRGTQFGFASGGNTEAILCSMPPNASW